MVPCTCDVSIPTDTPTLPIQSLTQAFDGAAPEHGGAHGLPDPRGVDEVDDGISIELNDAVPDPYPSSYLPSRSAHDATTEHPSARFPRVPAKGSATSYRSETPRSSSLGGARGGDYRGGAG